MNMPSYIQTLQFLFLLGMPLPKEAFGEAFTKFEEFFPMLIPQR
jgi:hypothetical protein